MSSTSFCSREPSWKTRRCLFSYRKSWITVLFPLCKNTAANFRYGERKIDLTGYDPPRDNFYIYQKRTFIYACYRQLLSCISCISKSILKRRVTLSVLLLLLIPILFWSSVLWNLYNFGIQYNWKLCLMLWISDLIGDTWNISYNLQLN